jgi:hypothetical protein
MMIPGCAWYRLFTAFPGFRCASPGVINIEHLPVSGFCNLLGICPAPLFSRSKAQIVNR